MSKIWADSAWEDYIYWQGQDRKTLRRINQILKDIARDGSARNGCHLPEIGGCQPFLF
jgi:toxin YoeB